MSFYSHFYEPDYEDRPLRCRHCEGCEQRDERIEVMQRLLYEQEETMEEWIQSNNKYLKSLGDK